MKSRNRRVIGVEFAPPETWTHQITQRNSAAPVGASPEKLTLYRRGRRLNGFGTLAVVRKRLPARIEATDRALMPGALSCLPTVAD